MQAYNTLHGLGTVEMYHLDFFFSVVGSGKVRKFLKHQPFTFTKGHS